MKNIKQRMAMFTNVIVNKFIVNKFNSLIK